MKKLNRRFFIQSLMSLGFFSLFPIKLKGFNNKDCETTADIEGPFYIPNSPNIYNIAPPEITSDFLFITGILLILISFTSPKLLKFPNFLWFKFGIFLSKIMTPLILSIIFYAVVAPMGIVYKLFNKNNKKTTWQTPKQKEDVDFNKQY